jgi:hypothetical protein
MEGQGAVRRPRGIAPSKPSVWDLREKEQEQARQARLQAKLQNLETVELEAPAQVSTRGRSSLLLKR